MPAAPTKTKAPTLTPEQEALRRATEALDSGSSEYQKMLLGSGSIRDAIARAVSEADPSLSQLRGSKADIDKRLGTVYSDSIADLQGITDPRLREQIRAQRSSEFGAEASKLGGLISDKRGSQDQTVERFANVYGASTAAKQFDVEQKRSALQRAIEAENQRSTRAQQLEDEKRRIAFETRFDDLTRREKEASIGAANRSNRGGGGSGLTFPQLVENPLLAFLSKGGQRVQDASGGFQFFGPDGKPINVDEAMRMAPGSTRSDFLAGSKNAADSEYSGQKPMSAEASKVRTSAQSGLQSLGQIESLIGISRGEKFLSKLPFGAGNTNAQQYQNATRNLYDVLARLRTGATITDKEEKLYKTFVPSATDTPASAKQKLGTLRLILEKLGIPQGATNQPSGGIDPSQFEQ